MPRYFQTERKSSSLEEEKEMLQLLGKHKKFKECREVFGNPLMGYAPYAWYENVSEDVKLLYMDITWRELEDREGEFCWEAIERKNQLSRWRREGRRIVLRFLCDVPGEKRHMDIPDWLFEKTQEAGSWYDMAYGKGFSPDYGNVIFRRCHEKTIRALGEHYGKDEFISYIELGSLGHWGEWHVNYPAGIRRLPETQIREEYVQVWMEAFPKAGFLMRQPFSAAKRWEFGLYNDMSGHPESTKEWLGLIQNGGDFWQTGEKNALEKMSDFWKKAPSGGELTSALSMEQLLCGDLERTAQLLTETHTTFLGPKTADPNFGEGYERLLRNMGYRIWISQAALKRKKDRLFVQLTWENSGNAPFYGKWFAYLYLEQANGEWSEKRQVDIELPKLLPGMQIRTETEFPEAALKNRRKHRLSIGIVDPLTARDEVRLAMNTEIRDGRALLFQEL